jgi:phosphoglycolate phosphatase-like HAD superfamily hydrolase
LQVCFCRLLQAAVSGDGNQLRETPGAAAFLRELQAHPSWRIAIATGGWEISARFKLLSAGLAVESFPLATADDSPSRAEILRTAIRRAGQRYGQASFQRTVYIGDAVWDVRAAKAPGVGFLGIAVGERARSLLHEGAPFVLPDFTEIPKAMRRLEAVT